MTLHSTSACVGGRHVAAQAITPVKSQPEQAAASALHPAVAWGLSSREQEVIEGYMEDGIAKLVARKLGISTKTVEIHLGNIRVKAGIGRSIALVLAYERMRRASEEVSHGA